MPVIYNEYKGYCIAKSRHDVSKPTEQSTIIHTDGFDHFNWGSIDEEHQRSYDKSYEESGEDSDSGSQSDMYADESKIALNHTGSTNDDHSDTDTISKKGKLSKKEIRDMKRRARGKPKGKRVVETNKSKKKAKKSKDDDPSYNEPSDPNKLIILNRLYKDTIAQFGAKKVREDAKILQFFDISLYKDDIDNLKDDEWLSDNNISFIYEYLERYQLSKYDKLVTQSIQLIRPSLVFMIAISDEPHLLRTQGVIPQLDNAKFIFLPVNDNFDPESVGGGLHWSLVVISILDETAYVFDTLGHSNEREAKRVISNMEKYYGKNTTFEVKIMDTPQQINGSDCGIMVVQITAFLLARLLKLNYLKDHYVDFELKNVEISAISGRIFTLGTLLNLIKHKKEITSPL
ncbi:CYFA0S12e03972g1_1 [Cyberlindnera fabianii]|uniref:CYFA0S12e03972g1_1 n=1 Tax=Cyberlindnera fabianii TaxID=36022 RepID=A0A061B1Q7_CYBFA|nr:CYFA0S12e03972g1_1 [Cyberlindnera fabianii]